MFALSARFSGLPYFAGVSPTDRGKSFAMEAIQMYDSCRRATGKPNLHLLQGSILLAFFFHTTGPSSRAWMLTGMVIRLAYELEIEKTDQVGRRILVVEDWIQIEEIRRAWWLVWELDTFASITCNRPYAIPREEVAVFLPISDENWFSGTFTASTTLKTSPEEAWKSLDGSKNQNPRAWFLVANHLASLALGPQSRNQQDQLTMDLSINCFRFALPKAFHPPLQRLITSEQMAERNWVICTYLTLSAHRVLHGSAGVSVTASTDFLHRVHSLQAFNAELAYIVDCWPTNAITVCQPLISCTLLASHHILWKVPDSLQDPSIRLGRALVDEILKRFAATWEIGMNLLSQYTRLLYLIQCSLQLTDRATEAIKAYQTAGSLTPEEEDLLSRLSRYIPNSPSSSRLVSMGPQLSHASNFQLNFQPELEDFTGNINPPHNCDGTSENSGSHRMTRDPSVDIFSFLDNSIDM
ncbi:hypothetical protein N7528_000846 [Penicillium herquei]|nr:hypothetical protein N7528_000846 [Penicillium herquei]